MVKWKESTIKSARDIPMVAEVPLIVYDKSTGFKAVVDETSKDTICVVPEQNQYIQHKQVWEQLDKLAGYKIKESAFLKSGRVLMVVLGQKTVEKVELLPGDYLERQVRVFNAYDRNRSLTVQGFGIRQVCTNGMIAPKAISGKAHIYAFGNNVFKGELEQNVDKCVEAWAEAQDLMKKAKATTVSVKDIQPQFGNLLAKKYMKIVFDHLGDKETVYDIWCEITRCLTHEVSPKVQRSCLLGAQKKVNKILELVIEQ